ncbi:carboxypeptidase-like regulatory domain-containing protein [Microbacterium fluvii]|uniref:Carboxypeptidase-like regulatory domain-containing protein n=1 Tax=Microbacterium fluvii TaxID=415215 RepID=A0ABW2H9A7_9MICO|nr:carboxypeptidase-like regulatory domain-containing protein [Microbacterium fluvii]MCU4671288.1 carboxypeptidase-like regulatory domain-containing protein [Microbacterium fluvii]
MLVLARARSLRVIVRFVVASLLGSLWVFGAAAPVAPESASISGRVEFPVGVSTAEGQTFVALYYSHSPTWSLSETAVGADGSYTISGLAAGTYLVEFRSSDRAVLDEWWNGAEDDADAATRIVLRAGETRSRVDVVLEESAVLSGTVSVPDGVDRAQGSTDVILRGVDGGGTSYTVGADGGFRFMGVRPGTYRLEVRSFDLPVLDQWWDGGDDYSHATPITLGTAEKRSDILVTPARSAIISGTVTLPEGIDPEVGSTTVLARTLDDRLLGSAFVERDGTYTIIGLPPGPVKLKFVSSGRQVATEWWQDQPDLASATVLNLAPEEVRNDVDATLGPGASISGSVQLPDGVDGNSGTVWVYAYAVGAPEKAAASTSVRGSDGWFSFHGLTPGEYKLQFVPQNLAAVGEWWRDARDFSSATVIALAPGQAREAVDAVLSSPPPATLTTATPTISGTIAYGSTLTAKPGSWTSGTTFTYQWYASGKAISGATKSTFTLASAQKAKTITVKVTGKKSGYTTVSKTSKATAKVATVATPKISGTAKVGKKLTAKPGTWTSGTKFTYQWYVGGKAISKATKSTFTLTKSQKGKTITVKVTGKKSGYATVAKTSKATGKV